MIQQRFPVLNFPRLDLLIDMPSDSPDTESEIRGRVYDPLRKKWVALTPEEWVREHFVKWMTSYLGYPVSFMANEYALNCNGRRRRCDTIVFTRDLKPLAIVEYKAPEIEITQKVFDQIVRYNMVCRARCLMVSNGLSHYCCIIDYGLGSYKFLEKVPSYAELTNLSDGSF